MARSSDPLRREALGVAAQLPTTRVEAPRTNAALQLAESLANATPELKEAMDTYNQGQADKARAEAKKDAIRSAGQELADATRAGVIKPTQNPWYIQAYNREGAAIRARSQLSQLQVESQTWEEVDDHAAFAQRWMQEAGSVAEAFGGEDYSAGFIAAEAQVTSQVLQTNTARNSARIVQEREQNVGALAQDALQQSLRARGGTLSANEAWAALAPIRETWFSTGGDELKWRQIVQTALVTTAEGNGDKYLLQLARAPELLYGPSEEGDKIRFGMGATEGRDYTGVTSSVGPQEVAIPASVPAGQEPSPQATPIKVDAPKRAGFTIPMPIPGGVSSGYGTRKAPTKGASTNHLAIDIPAAAGTPIQAQAHGKVIAAGKSGGLGNRVVVDYGGGVTATYAHMRDINVAEGDIVSPGQSVGGVGRTGTATGNHLHYRLEVNGKPVDPRTFKGTVGGTFEGTQGTGENAAPPIPTFPGFTGTDQPYDATAKPANVALRGPSLYSLPGVSAEIEQASYLIGQRNELAANERLRLETAKRNEQAFALKDQLYAKYGTQLLTGQVTRGQMMETLGAMGVSAPVIALTLGQVQNDIAESAGVAEAQMRAHGTNPGAAKEVMDLQVEAQTKGYSADLEARVSEKVLTGELSGDDGARIVGGAFSRSEQVRKEGESDARQAEADAQSKPGAAVKNASRLNEEAGNLAAFIYQQVNARGGKLGEKQLESLNIKLVLIAKAHLASNPGDYEGAYAKAKAAAATALQSLLASAAKKPQKKKPTSGAGNGAKVNPRGS